MRLNRVAEVALLVLMAGLNACGTKSTADGGMPDLTMVTPPDMAMPKPMDAALPPDLVYVVPTDAGGFGCGAAQCDPGAECCYTVDPDGGANLVTNCMSDCTDDKVMQFACGGPGNCGGNPCCLGIGQTLHDATCGTSPTDCVPIADIPNSMIITRLCQADGDCTAGGMPTSLAQCCTLTQAGQVYHLCFSADVASKVGGGYTCP